MLELLMAMVMLNVGILAIVAAFSSGNAALSRANRISTAGALANKQMEVYRGLKYDNIVFTTSEWTAAHRRLHLHRATPSTSRTC